MEAERLIAQNLLRNPKIFQWNTGNWRNVRTVLIVAN